MKISAKGITNKVLGRTTRSSSRYASSRAGSDMSTDPPTDPQPPSSLAAPQRVLLTATHLALKDAGEKNIYNKLKSRNFVHTSVLDDVFLCETGWQLNLTLFSSLLVGVFLHL